jgi:Holliday junction resolvase RusA-like endonuclease
MTASLFAAPRPAVKLPLTLVIPGAPRTKKTHSQIVRVRGSVRLIPSAAWRQWVCNAKASMADVWRKRYELDIELNIAARFYRDRAQGDCVGLMQGLADLLQELRVVDDDKRFVQWDGTRMFVDHACPRTEVTLTAV